MFFRNKNKEIEEHILLNKQDPDYWRSIPLGSTVTLTDEAAIAEAMRIGIGVKGLDYSVKLAEVARDSQQLAEWWFYYIEGHKTENLWLMVKIISDDIIPIIYFEVEDFPPMLRSRLIRDGQTWLFEKVTDDGEPHAPVFCSDIYQTVEDEDGEEMEVQYRCKPQGTVYGHYSRVPSEAGMDKVFIAFAEYEADESFENPELLVVEKGGEHESDGGLVSLYVGGLTVFNDIEILRVNA
jgi:hypothetical protein